jgi:hypothetical protein
MTGPPIKTFGGDALGYIFANAFEAPSACCGVDSFPIEQK